MTQAYEGRLAFDPDTQMHLADTFEERPLNDEEKEARISVLMAAGVPEPDAEKLVEKETVKQFHAVVSDDGGETWRYATDEDESHFDSYHQRFAVVDTTDNALARLSFEHGQAKAEEIMRKENPHHFEIQPDDPHYEEGAIDMVGNVTNTRLRFDPDRKAAKLMGHTASYKGKAEIKKKGAKKS
jgi:hypothetical protein